LANNPTVIDSNQLMEKYAMVQAVSIVNPFPHFMDLAAQTIIVKCGFN